MKERLHGQESFGQAGVAEWNEEGTKKKRIAVIEFGGNESIGKENCGRVIENRADLTTLANVVERRRADGRDACRKIYHCRTRHQGFDSE